MDRIPLDTEKRVAEDGPIGWLRFDDPAPRNALSNEMQTALPNGLRRHPRRASAGVPGPLTA